ncbi:MAG: hypothetical protein JO210_17645 [Acidobacteriaceae bacterium]|nr:hypothetical protein [Acidobacteriaceae bacterium]
MNLRAILSLVGALASSASACPLCHSQTGEQIRAALFARDFWFNVTATILPFAIFALITGLIYFGGPGAKPRVADSSRTNTEDQEAQ